MNIKNLWRLFPIFIIIGIIIFFERKGYSEREEFHKTAINSLITKKKSNWSGGRSYDYLTRNNIVITLLNNNLLQVGDSISKGANTDEFNVYRKNKENKYEFYNSYNTKQ